MECIEFSGIDIGTQYLSAVVADIFRQIDRGWRRTKLLPAGLPKSQPRFGTNGDPVNDEEQSRKIIDRLTVILDSHFQGALFRLSGYAWRRPKQQQQQRVKKPRRSHHCGLA
jgi:hypothetical protein